MSALKMLLALGKALGTPVEFDNANASDVTYGSSGASAQLLMDANGALTLYGNNSSQPVNHWIDPQVGMDQYEIYAVKDSGSTLTSGTLNTWLALSSSNSWSYSVPTSGSLSGLFTFTVRKIGTTTPTWVSSNVGISAIADVGDPP